MEGDPSDKDGDMCTGTSCAPLLGGWGHQLSFGEGGQGGFQDASHGTRALVK
jgi:hypothetical protein